jgi:hypothetical protein
MRRTALVLGMLLLSGCASLPAPEVRRERISRWFRSWWKTGDTAQPASQPGADDELHTVHWLNSLIGNGSDSYPLDRH